MKRNCMLRLRTERLSRPANITSTSKSSKAKEAEADEEGDQILPQEEVDFGSHHIPSTSPPLAFSEETNKAFPRNNGSHSPHHVRLPPPKAFASSTRSLRS